MKDFSALLAIPLLLFIIIIIQEKNTDALVYELVCTDPFVDEAINNVKKKIAYRTIEVLQNPGSINAANTNKKIKHLHQAETITNLCNAYTGLSRTYNKLCHKPRGNIRSAYTNAINRECN